VVVDDEGYLLIQGKISLYEGVINWVTPCDPSGTWAVQHTPYILAPHSLTFKGA